MPIAQPETARATSASTVDWAMTRASSGVHRDPRCAIALRNARSSVGGLLWHWIYSSIFCNVCSSRCATAASVIRGNSAKSIGQRRQMRHNSSMSFSALSRASS